MNSLRPPLNMSPNWLQFVGYSHGMPQFSIITNEVFPKGPRADATTATFLDVIGRMVESSVTAKPPKIDETRTGCIATATAIAAASCCLQVSVRLPVVTDFRVDRIKAPGPDERFRLILPYWDAEATKTSYAFCAELWNRLFAGERFGDLAPLQQSLNDRLGPFVSEKINQFSLVKGITDLGVNLIHLPDGLLCLGTGAKSRWMLGTRSDATSGIGLRLAGKKFITALMLRRSGLPGAENLRVTSAEEAVAVSAQFDGPVVVKPGDRDRGEGVAADLRTAAEIRAAFEAASAFSTNIIVEKMIPGFTHRLTVASDEVISVRQRVPGGVTGDGISTVTELVAVVKESERSKNWERTHGQPQIDLDAEALGLMSRDGITENTVLPDGQFLRLRRRDNINAGGENRDLRLTEVHPDNLDLAVRATQLLRLDVAGVDLITTDITRSWRDVGAGICEVNAAPQFASFSRPEIFREIISRIVGPDPHVPAYLVLCHDDSADRAAVVAAVKERAPRRTVSTKEGLWREGTLLTSSFNNGFIAAVTAASHTDTESMTCIMSMREILSKGSPLRSWSGISILKQGLSDEELSLVPAVQAVLAPTEFGTGAARSNQFSDR